MADDDKVQISIVDSPHSIIWLHPSLCGRLKLASREPLRIVHGEMSLDVHFVADSFRSRNEVAISRQIADKLLLGGYPFPVYALVKHRTLQIGPLIGILCKPAWNERNKTMRSFAQLFGLRKLMQEGATAGAICYLFSLENVNFSKLSVRAYLLDRETWKEQMLPLPDAIYDQIISRRFEQKENSAIARKSLSMIYGERIFNDGFFDKWQVHEWLSSEPKMKSHILDTVHHTSMQTASQFLQKYQTTFLKPVHGSLGVGIARFVKQSDGSFVYDLKQSTTSLAHGRAKNALEAVKIFEKKLKRRSYVWQEGLTLLTYKDRPVDIRILMQRDESGEWKRTKMFARVAKQGDFTSNLSSGGEALPMDDVLADPNTGLRLKQKCRQQIARVSKLTAETLEQESGKTFGELGIDLGIDKAGNVFVIEVNAKPRKSPTTEKGRQDLVDLAFQRPMRYAIRLAMSR
jgi:hypothetical protein